MLISHGSHWNAGRRLARHIPFALVLTMILATPAVAAGPGLYAGALGNCVTVGADECQGGSEIRLPVGIGEGEDIVIGVSDASGNDLFCVRVSTGGPDLENCKELLCKISNELCGEEIRIDRRIDPATLA